MTEMDKLTQKVKDGLTHHQYATKPCHGCPYRDQNTPFSCSSKLAEDALKVIDYWKGKYENTELDTPPMTLNVAPEPIRIEPVDIRSTLKSIKAMERLEKVAKKATESLGEASEAIRALKEELEND